MQLQNIDWDTFLWSRYDKVGNCWIWNGPIKRNKKYIYDVRGQLYLPRVRKSLWVHRLAYELTKGEIPKGMLIRHTCDNTLCINPKHLLLGTAKDNYDDMVSRNRAFYQKRTHCKYGHPWNEENTSYIYNSTLGYTMRRCKTCHARDRKKYRLAKQARDRKNTI